MNECSNFANIAERAASLRHWHDPCVVLTYGYYVWKCGIRRTNKKGTPLGGPLTLSQILRLVHVKSVEVGLPVEMFLGRGFGSLFLFLAPFGVPPSERLGELLPRGRTLTPSLWG